jgi:hypothetical protein
MRSNDKRSGQRKRRESVEAAAVIKNLAAINYSSKGQASLKGVKSGKEFGRLIAFSDADGGKELKQLKSLRDLIVRFARQPAPPRPLCLAVFGPPGSGKSFAVKQIRAQADVALAKAKKRTAGGPAPVKLSFETVNLTQVTHTNDLARVLARIARSASREAVPLVLFDEFDAVRDNAPYGWLSWFLAPMHDGTFVHAGDNVDLKRAVYVFAGGTTDTMAQFSALSAAQAFRSAKGPDFVSRLRGYLDVYGPNAQPRVLRRALLIHSELREQATRNGSGAFRIDRKLAESLLHVGRYRHGARSIAAIVELSDLNPAKSKFGWSELPQNHLLELHVDRGPLDARLIGGSIALSGYPSGNEKNLARIWQSLAECLWDDGATLSFSGTWGAGAGGQLMQHLLTGLRARKVEPWRSQQRREEPAPWLENYLNEDAAKKVDSSVSPQERARLGLRVIPASHLSKREQSDFNEWQLRALERFRRRLSVTEGSVARFAIGGATEKHKGRMPGIIEELMLALATNSPIYVAGGCGGAARDAGSLLGLAQPRTGEAPRSLRALSSTLQSALDDIASKLRPSPWPGLPVKPEEVATFLREHAIGGSKWPDNGLTARENRLLFEATSWREIRRLVHKGLLQRFGMR